MNQITPHLFGENTVRTTLISGEPWFVAKDICAILGLENNSQAISSLRDCEKGVTISDRLSPGGAQETRIINEPGLYRLIFKSRKAEAVAFQDWVFSEVLPAIRRTGFYGRREQAVTAFVRELVEIGVPGKDAARLALASYPPLTHAERLAMDRAAGLDVPCANPLHEIVLSAMDQGAEYNLAQIRQFLNGRPELPSTLSPKAADARVGHILREMRDLGLITSRTGTGRQRLYTRQRSKIIPIRTA